MNYYDTLKHFVLVSFLVFADMAPILWKVIFIAGSYREKPTKALHIRIKLKAKVERCN